MLSVLEQIGLSQQLKGQKPTIKVNDGFETQGSYNPCVTTQHVPAEEVTKPSLSLAEQLKNQGVAMPEVINFYPKKNEEVAPSVNQEVEVEAVPQVVEVRLPTLEEQLNSRRNTETVEVSPQVAQAPLSVLDQIREQQKPKKGVALFGGQFVV